MQLNDATGSDEMKQQRERMREDLRFDFNFDFVTQLDNDVTAEERNRPGRGGGRGGETSLTLPTQLDTPRWMLDTRACTRSVPESSVVDGM